MSHSLGTGVPEQERFWSYVVRTNGCWVWRGGRDMGYGAFKLSGGKATKNTRAHQYSWELHYGPIPPKMLICHHCDNRLCVRPDHLFLGTRADNVEDARKKARCGKKLTPPEVQTIRVLAAEGHQRKALAIRFNITYGTLKRILNRQSWGGLE